MQRRQLRRIALGRIKTRLGDAPDPEDRAFDLGISEPIIAEILARHNGGGGNHALFAEAGGEQRAEPRGLRRCVEGRRRRLILDDHHRHPVFGHPRRNRLAARDPRDSAKQMVAHLGLVAAHGEQQLGLVRNDIMLGTRMKAADGHDRRVEWIEFARDQSLQRADNPRCEDDRILGRLRARAMAADSGNGEVDRIGARERIAVGIADHACWKIGRIVKGDRRIGARKARKQAVVEHRARATDAFLGGLADHHQRAAPRAAIGDEQPRGADPCGHMRIMPARVHHARFNAFDAGRADL